MLAFDRVLCAEVLDVFIAELGRLAAHERIAW